MEIRITYVGTLNGVNGIWCGFKPEGAIITEERPVLYPSNGFILIKKNTDETYNSVWLKDGDVEENYGEIEEPEDPEEISEES